MCGICGIAGDVHDRESIVRTMTSALAHRGPDDEGFLCTPAAAVGMRRLAVIDVDGGHQPISTDDGRVHIVFNGEIYNYVQLQDRARAAGAVFKTSSDTEVIIRLYELYGQAAIPMLEGMFAVCIVDTREDAVFLARDRFGEKPLYYSIVGNVLAFSSELRSLVKWGGIPRSVDVEALRYYLAYGFPPPPLTLYRGIVQLPPASILRKYKSTIDVHQYWRASYSVRPEFSRLGTATAAVREALLAAVKRQMVSDVPLGAFLSGGIDSSSVVAAMQRQSAKPIKTFTVKFEYAPYDESAIAREVAHHLGTEHYEYVVTNGAFVLDDLQRIVRHVGQPFSDSSAIPTFFISRAIRNEVTVCLSGDGGDEMFAGYTYFLWLLKVDRAAALLPRPIASAAARFLRAASAAPLLSRATPLRAAARGIKLAAYDRSLRPAALGRLFDDDEIADLIRPEFASYSVLPIDRVAELAAPNEESALREMMQFRLRYSLPEDMLTKVDRMSMAASLEVRAPMLDVEIARVAMGMPDEMLIRNGVTKYVLREAVREWLPENVFSHPKSGFSIPLHMFQNDVYASACRDLILEQPAMTTLFDAVALRRVVERGLSRTQDRADISVYRASHQVWALLQLGAWLQEFSISL